jgi:hypothetical protein
MRCFPLSRLLLIAALSAGLAACGGNAPTLTVPVSPANAYLLTSNNRIIGVDLDDLEFARSVAAVTKSSGSTTALGALDADENILDIDYRNAEGVLYGLSRKGNNEAWIIRIEPRSGAMTRVVKLSPDSTDSTAPYTGLASGDFSIDFNPADDRLRIIGQDGTNLHVDALTGEVITDTNITDTNMNPGTPKVTGIAYRDDFTTQDGRTAPLFSIDLTAGTTGQVFATDANNGTLSSPKNLGLTNAPTSSLGGYDINPTNNVGVAAVTHNGFARVYTIDPSATGNAAQLMGTLPKLPTLEFYNGIGLVTTANPTVTALTSDNKIRTFRANQPSAVSNEVSLTGLTGAEKIIGIDFRQSDRTLYALSDDSNIYSVASNGALSSKSTLTPPINGQYTLDFNPVLLSGETQNHLRLIGIDLSNAIINVDSGNVSPEKPVSGTPTPVVKAAAYLNNFRSAAATNLLVIDSANSTLNVQDISTNLSQGALTRISALGITLDLNSPVGFDISGRNNENQLLMARTATTDNFSLYRVNSAVTSNPLTLVGVIAESKLFIDIAIRF